MLSLLILSLLACVARAEDLVRDRNLVGWLGDTYSGNRATEDDTGMVVLSWEPRIFLYRKFLTPEECDYLMQKAKPRLFRSGVSDSVTGQVCFVWMGTQPQHGAALGHAKRSLHHLLLPFLNRGKQATSAPAAACSLALVSAWT